MKSTTLDRVELALARAVYLGTVALQLTVFFALIELAPNQMWAASPSKVTSHQVIYDSYSLSVDGQRVLIYSGEVHPFRLPSPSLWLDVLQKIKAAGFNAISCYFDWGYHSAAPGVYDFTGVRDLDLFLDLANQVGLYVIARPGPYINAETDGGGFPAWLNREGGNVRSTDPKFLEWADEWMGQIDAILARHQLTNGTGSVIADQIENELYDPSASGLQYMQDLENKARADGITVPLTFNEITLGSTLYITGLGAVQLPGFDSYPNGFNPSQPNTWGQVPNYDADQSLLQNSPLFAPEFGGGTTDQWGGPGYQNCYELTDSNYESVFFKSLIGQGLAMMNFYMTYGGTSWGWLPYSGRPTSFITSVYTSYDYGAAISEARLLTDKYAEQKRIAHLLQAVPPLTQTNVVTSAPAPTNSAILQYTRENPSTNTFLYVLRHSDATSTNDDTTQITVDTPDGNYPTVPQQAGTSIEIAGRDAKLLLAHFDFKTAHLVYSTSELMTEAYTGDSDNVVFYGQAGQSGETVLRYSSQPAVKVLAGSVSWSYDNSTGDLRLNYVHNGLIRVQVVSSAGTLSLLLADYPTTATFWERNVGSQQLLVAGPYLLRSLALYGDTINLTGDLNAETTLEVFAPASANRITWNGRPVNAQRTSYGTLTASLNGPAPVQLPNLTNWKFQFESFERNADFDDSHWIVANHATTNNPNPPGSLPVLYEDDYGFHHGDVWYRGHFTATGNETGINLDGEGGIYGIYSVWLNGAFLGTQPTGPYTFSFPSSALKKGQDNVVSVLVMNMGHNESYSPFNNGANSTYDPRGLTTAVLQGNTNAVLTWRIQGNLGGEKLWDPARGPLNNGGLYGERYGWYLPFFNDFDWQQVSLPDSWAARQLPAGVGWYRTSFNLRLPENTDVPIGIQINDTTSSAYRALIFVNGWQMGIYVNNLGPERIFPIPTGILNPNGENTIAIAVWGEQGGSGGLGAVTLFEYGNFSGGVPIQLVPAPQAMH